MVSYQARRGKKRAQREPGSSAHGCAPEPGASAEPFRAPAKALGGSEPEPYLLARGSALLFAARTVSGPARDAFQRDSRRVPPSRCAPAAGRLGPRATLGRPCRTSDDCGAALKRVEAARSPSGVRDIGSAPERPPPPRPRARSCGGSRPSRPPTRDLRVNPWRCGAPTQCSRLRFTSRRYRGSRTRIRGSVWPSAQRLTCATGRSSSGAGDAGQRFGARTGAARARGSLARGHGAAQIVVRAT